MSQAGALNTTNSSPTIPTSFPTNNGTAIPSSNQLKIDGGLGTRTKVGASNEVLIDVFGVSSSTSGQIYQSTGSATDPAFTTAKYPSISAQGDLLLSSSANTIVTLAKSTTATRYLANTGTNNNAQWDQVNVTNGITGVLPIVNGGTNASSMSNTDGVVYFDGTRLVTTPVGTLGQILQSQGSGSPPAYTTATYPATTTINQLLYSSAANTVAGLATANNGVLTTGTSGTPVITALSTDGQVIIGSSAGAPAAATLSAGTGITITNGHNTISIALTNPSGFSWTDVTGATQTLAVDTGYITDRGGGVTYTLPSTAALGDTIKIVGKLGLATITPNANQQILIGSTSGLVGVTGTATSTNVGDCIELICTTAGASTVWRADSVIGTWSLVTS